MVSFAGDGIHYSDIVERLSCSLKSYLETFIPYEPVPLVVL